MAVAAPKGWRRQVHLWLDHGAGDDPVANGIHRGLVLLICANVAAIVLESVPDIAARFGPVFHALETVSLALFALEYVARLWVAPEHVRYRALTPAQARLTYAASLPAMVDLLATLPLAFAMLGLADLQFLLLLRLLRFFKLGRDSPGMASLAAALQAERKALFACFVVLMGVMLMTASVMHLVEREAHEVPRVGLRRVLRRQFLLVRREPAGQLLFGLALRRGNQWIGLLGDLDRLVFRLELTNPFVGIDPHRSASIVDADVSAVHSVLKLGFWGVALVIGERTILGLKPLAEPFVPFVECLAHVRIDSQQAGTERMAEDKHAAAGADILLDLD